MTRVAGLNRRYGRQYMHVCCTKDQLGDTLWWRGKECPCSVPLPKRSTFQVPLRHGTSLTTNQTTYPLTPAGHVDNIFGHLETRPSQTPKANGGEFLLEQSVPASLLTVPSGWNRQASGEHATSPPCFELCWWGGEVGSLTYLWSCPFCYNSCEAACSQRNELHTYTQHYKLGSTRVSSSEWSCTAIEWGKKKDFFVVGASKSLSFLPFPEMGDLCSGSCQACVFHDSQLPPS